MTRALPDPDHRTLSDRIADHLREAILRGEIEAGQPLRQAHLASQFGVSPSPLREALRELEAEGLVTFKPYCGAVVAPFSEDELRQIGDLLVLLESYALRLAQPALTEDLLAHADEHLGRLDRETDPRRRGESLALVRAALYAPSGQALLLELLRQLEARQRRYLRLLPAAEPAPRPSAERLRQVLAALRAGDVEGAIDAMAEEHAATADALAAALAAMRGTAAR